MERLDSSRPSPEDLSELLLALMSLQNEQEGYEFLVDLCSASELSTMQERWEIARSLWSGLPYKRIESETQTSSTTIARVAKSLFRPCSGYESVLKRLLPLAGHRRDNFVDRK